MESEDPVERARWLEKEIENLQTELDLIQERDNLWDKATMTTEEKVVAFDKIYDYALEQVEYVIEHGRNVKDHRYYMWETAMRWTLGVNVFAVYNAYID